MKHLRRIVAILLIVVVLISTLAFIPKPKYQKENPFISQTGLPLVMAHQGGKVNYPSNTMASYQDAFDMGADVLEMDVQMTSDGVLVLLHGQNKTGNTIGGSNCDTVVWNETYEYLYDYCNFGYNFEDEQGEYPYQEMTSDEWQAANVHLATLEEVFTAFGTDILYNIEIKADADAPRTETADALYALIHEHNLENHVLVATAKDDISEYLVDTYPSLIVSASYGSAQDIVLPIYTFTSVFTGRPQYASLQVPTSYNLPVIGDLSLDTKLLINTLHQHNMAINYWTINDEETMRFLIEQGADGIITDNPELLISILEEYR